MQAFMRPRGSIIRMFVTLQHNGADSMTLQQNDSDVMTSQYNDSDLMTLQHNDIDPMTLQHNLLGFDDLATRFTRIR